MNAISGLQSPALTSATSFAQKAPQPPAVKPSQDDKKLREAFDTFVGEVFFGQMLQSMRKTVDKPAYFHGGRAEEVFQTQLDQVLSGKMTEASASSFTGPMFNLFQLSRS